jgi:hypothetical protein
VERGCDHCHPSRISDVQVASDVSVVRNTPQAGVSTIRRLLASSPRARTPRPDRARVPCKRCHPIPGSPLARKYRALCRWSCPTAFDSENGGPTPQHWPTDARLPRSFDRLKRLVPNTNPRSTSPALSPPVPITHASPHTPRSPVAGRRGKWCGSCSRSRSQHSTSHLFRLCRN